MTHHDELDRTLVSFLSDDTTRRAPAGLLDAIDAKTRTRAQQPGWIVALLGQSMGASLPARTRTRRVVLLAAVAVLALVVIALVAGRQEQNNRLGMGFIAYVHGGDVYIANPDGSQPRVVLHQEGIAFSTVAWSSIGDRLAIDGETGVVVLDVATGSWRFVGGHNPAWSPDGLRLAVVGAWTRVRGLRIVDPATGAVGAEYEFGAVGGLAWSPNGRWIAASGDCTGPRCPSDGGSAANAVIRIDVATGEVIQLDGRSGHLDAVRQVAWAPDSRHIAYIRWGSTKFHGCSDRAGCSTDVIVADADGSNDRPVSRVPGLADQPAWSPDGLWMSFRELDRSTERYQIVIERSDGTAAHSLVSLDAQGYVWGPESDRLWFTVKRSGDAAATVWEASLDGTTRPLGVAIDTGSTPFGSTGLAVGWQLLAPGASAAQLPPASTTTPAATLPVVTPAPAAPADAAAWSTLVTQRADACTLVRVAITDGKATKVADLCDPQPTSFSTGSWSPTGSAYATIRDGRLSIFDLGGHVKLNVAGLTDLQEIAWSPDGRWLTVTGARTYLVRSDGAGLRELPSGGTSWLPDSRTIALAQDDGELLIGRVDGAAFSSIGTFPKPATWSPDGSRFGFIRDGDLWTAAVDGTDVRNATSLSLGGASWAAWSPDGRWIAVLGSHGLWLVHPDGTERRWLPMPGDFTSDAIWSPDSTRLAVQAYADSTAGKQSDRVYLVNADGSTTVRVDGTTTPRWSPDGRFLVAIDAGPAAVGFEPGSLILLNADGSGRRSLGTSGIEGAGLVWLR